MSYLRGDYYFWTSDDDTMGGVEVMHVWTIHENYLASGDYDPHWRSVAKVPMTAFDKVVRRRAAELGWTPPLVEAE